MLIQSRVLKWETLLVEKPVEEKADYTALDAAIKTAEDLLAKGTDNYTDDSVKVLQDALAEGKALSRDLLASEQAKVDAAEQLSMQQCRSQRRMLTTQLSMQL